MIIDLTDGMTFEVRGVPEADLERLLAASKGREAWRRIFPVFVGDVDSVDLGDRLPMAGTYRIEAGMIRFSPRYPLLPGQRYSAVFDPGYLGGARRIVARFDLPSVDGPSTRALRIYPSAGVLPENLLRFHLCFSAPMREGEALRRVRLLSDEGQEVQGVFVDTRVELWDPSMTRLSLLLDPGRVKTGLLAHEALGRALVVGLRYRLVIDERFRDARGEPLLGALEKRFSVACASSVPPDARRWELDLPSARTRDPLTVRFPGPLDIVQLSMFMGVRRMEGNGLRGEISVGRDETLWQFVPEEPWERGHHALSVDTRLEDVAGNNLNGLFDRPGQSTEASPRGQTVSLPFQIQ
jgi:hypothetical protein